MGDKKLEAPRRLETARLALVAAEAHDADEVFERYASDADVTRYLGWPRHRSAADTRAFLAYSAAEWKRWPAGPYLIRARADGRLLGSTGLEFQDRDTAFTGYVLARDAWGHGYATEALGAMVDLARRLGVTRLRAVCHAAHRASQHVLEKAGFVLDRGWVKQAAFPNLPPAESHDAIRYELSLRGERLDA